MLTLTAVALCTCMSTLLMAYHWLVSAHTFFYAHFAHIHANTYFHYKNLRCNNQPIKYSLFIAYVAYLQINGHFRQIQLKLGAFLRCLLTLCDNVCTLYCIYLSNKLENGVSTFISNAIYYISNDFVRQTALGRR